MHITLYKTTKFYGLNQSRSILLVPPKYTLENYKIWSFLPYLMTSSLSHVT